MGTESAGVASSADPDPDGMAAAGMAAAGMVAEAVEAAVPAGKNPELHTFELSLGADYTYSWKLDTLSDMIVQPEPQGSEPLLSACKAHLFRPASIRLFIFWKLVRKGLLLQPLFGKMRFCSGSSL